MSLIALSEIFETLQWHSGREEKPGSKVGVFIKVPKELARQFPPKENDKSPVHITACYIGNFNTCFEEKLLNIIQQVCSQFKPFTIRLSKPKVFPGENEGELALHSPVKSSKLFKFHEVLKQSLKSNQIQVDNAHPEFSPHITIAYLKDKKEKKKYKDFRPCGEFLAQDIWVWGGNEPHLVTLGK